MKEFIVSNWSWAILFILIFILFLIVHKRFKERNVWGRIVKKYKENTDQKILSEAEFVTKFGSIESNSLLYKLDRLVVTSGIHRYMPHFNGEAFLITMFALGAAGFFEGSILFSNIFVAIFLAAAQVVAFYVFIKALSGKTYNAIEDGTAIFISILSNHAKGSSDIVTIMQKTAVIL